MTKPLQEVDTRFDELLQDLPSDMVELAYQCRAFVRARKITSPAQLLRLVLSYCGLDQSLREAGAVMALRGQPMCDQSVKERLLSCLPWIEALLKEMIPVPELPLPEGPQRWLVCDGSTVQAPGATTTDYRVHVCLDVVRVAVVQVKVTDQKTGESLAHFSLGAGDTVLADRGYATAHEIVSTRRRQAHVVMRMSAHNLPLFDAPAEPIDLQAVLRRDPQATRLTLPVWITDPQSHERVAAWVHAARLDERAAEAERRRLHRRAQKNGQTVKASTLFFADWLLVVTTWPPDPFFHSSCACRDAWGPSVGAPSSSASDGQTSGASPSMSPQGRTHSLPRPPRPIWCEPRPGRPVLSILLPPADSSAIACRRVPHDDAAGPHPIHVGDTRLPNPAVCDHEP